MTGKERAAYRAQANTLEPLFQIGKSGVTEAVAAQLMTAYNTRELVKIRVLLDSSPDMPRAAAQKLAEMTESEIIQVIGGVVVAPKASDLILPIALAVEHRLTVDQLARAFSVYPSLSGAVTDAARAMHIVG